jgi:DNA-binding MarR family transcriptional regulator
MTGTQKLESAIELYARSHGLTVEQARVLIAMNAEVLSRGFIITATEDAVLRFILRCDHVWTQAEIGRSLGLTGSRISLVLRDLARKGVLVPRAQPQFQVAGLEG